MTFIWPRLHQFVNADSPNYFEIWRGVPKTSCTSYRLEKYCFHVTALNAYHIIASYLNLDVVDHDLQKGERMIPYIKRCY